MNLKAGRAAPPPSWILCLSARHLLQIDLRASLFCSWAFSPHYGPRSDPTSSRPVVFLSCRRPILPGEKFELRRPRIPSARWMTTAPSGRAPRISPLPRSWHGGTGGTGRKKKRIPLCPIRAKGGVGARAKGGIHHRRSRRRRPEARTSRSTPYFRKGLTVKN